MVRIQYLESIQNIKPWILELLAYEKNLKFWSSEVSHIWNSDVVGTHLSGRVVPRYSVLKAVFHMMRLTSQHLDICAASRLFFLGRKLKGTTQVERLRSRLALQCVREWTTYELSKNLAHHNLRSPVVVFLTVHHGAISRVCYPAPSALQILYMCRFQVPWHPHFSKR